MPRSSFPAAFALAGLCLAAPPASACPLCDTQTAEQVRRGLVDEHLPVSVAAVVVPLLATAGVVALVPTGGARGRGTR